MEAINFDQASTTFPKAPGTAEAVFRFMTECGCNISRGSYEGAYSAEEMVYDTRVLLAGMFHGRDPKNVIFTKNVTESLNVLIKGLLKSGDHVLISGLEHNAVMRPLVQLEKHGVRFTRIPCREDGTLITESIEPLIEPATRAIIMTHASNVCGTVMPIREVGALCAKHGIRFIVDSAQTAGVLPLDMEDMQIDALAFTGHKGLLGPQGTGGFIIKDDLSRELEPLLSGGTGSISHTEDVPDFLPDRFEPGTLNLPGIAGLNASLKWLASRQPGSIFLHELTLTDSFLSQIAHMESDGKLRIVGLPGVGLHNSTNRTGCAPASDPVKDPALSDALAHPVRTGVVSVVPKQMDPAELAFRLDDEYGIATRVGLHCAPSAHRTLRTYPSGTVRFSFGAFHETEQIDQAVRALTAILYG